MAKDNVLSLLEGEKIVHVVHQDARAYLVPWTCYSIWVAVPFFFFFPLMHLGVVGVLVFVGLVVSGAGLLLRSGLRWAQSVLLVTTERLIDVDQHGVFKQIVTELFYEDIASVKFQIRGWWQQVFRIGSLYVRAKGDEPDLLFDAVRDPSRIRHLIQELARDVLS